MENLKLNTIEEAIIILKENKKAKKHEYSNKFKNINERTEDDKKFVIKEAELIIADYLKETEPDNTSVKRKLRRLKCTSAILGLLLIVSIIF